MNYESDDLKAQERDAILSALNKSALVSITDLAGNITYANDKFVEVSKYSREELLGKNHRILKSGDQPDSLFADLWSTVCSGKTWRGEIKNKAKDGTWYWVDTTISPILSAEHKPVGYFSVRFLITEKKYIQEELLLSKLKTDEMLRSIGEGVVATDEQGAITFVNDAFEEIIGIRRSQVFGKKLSEVLPLYDNGGQLVPYSQRPVTNVLSSNTSSRIFYRGSYERIDKTRFPVELLISPIRLHGKTAGAIQVFRNTTDEITFQNTQHAFITLASHQLRTPLTAFRLAIEALRKRVQFSKQENELLDETKTYITRMQQTINTMLNISHIEEGTIAPHFAATNLSESLFSTLHSHYIDSRVYPHHQFTFTYPDSLLCVTDTALLREVIVAIISNATKYSPGTSTIEVSGTDTGSEIQLSIKDQGYGIPPEEQDMVFLKFFRASNVREISTDGTGIGLYLAKQIMQLLKGSVTFTSSQKNGTIFTIHIPKSIS